MGHPLRLRRRCKRRSSCGQHLVNRAAPDSGERSGFLIGSEKTHFARDKSSKNRIYTVSLCPGLLDVGRASMNTNRLHYAQLVPSTASVIARAKASAADKARRSRANEARHQSHKTPQIDRKLNENRERLNETKDLSVALACKQGGQSQPRMTRRGASDAFDAFDAPFFGILSGAQYAVLVLKKPPKTVWEERFLFPIRGPILLGTLSAADWAAPAITQNDIESEGHAARRSPIRRGRCSGP